MKICNKENKKKKYDKNYIKRKEFVNEKEDIKKFMEVHLLGMARTIKAIVSHLAYIWLLLPQAKEKKAQSARLLLYEEMLSFSLLIDLYGYQCPRETTNYQTEW